MQHPERQAHHLQILATRRGADVPWLGPDIIDDCALKPGYEEVGAFVDDLVFDTAQTVENDGARAAFDVVEGGLGERDADRGGDGEAVERA